MVKERQFRISRQADKFISSLPEKERKKVKKAVSYLITGNTESLDIKKFVGYPKEFRLRVGKIRLLFKSTPEMLFIFKADFRKDVYR